MAPGIWDNGADEPGKYVEPIAADKTSYLAKSAVLIGTPIKATEPPAALILDSLPLWSSTGVVLGENRLAKQRMQTHR